MADQPIVCAALRALHRQVRPDLAALAIQLMAHEAALRAVQLPVVSDPILFDLCPGRPVFGVKLSANAAANLVKQPKYSLPTSVFSVGSWPW
jgi:hypothetical protein